MDDTTTNPAASPAVSYPRLVFGHPVRPPFSVGAADFTPTPKGRLARIDAALREAGGVAQARYREWCEQETKDQEQEDRAPRPPPLILVCCADSTIGRSLIDAGRPGLSGQVCGPVVMLLHVQELLQLFQASAQSIMQELSALEAKPGQPVWGFAVNGNLFDFRVMTVETAPPAPTAPAEAAKPEPVIVPPAPPEEPAPTIEVEPAGEPAAAT
jgi:hypothetical protein